MQLSTVHVSIESGDGTQVIVKCAGQHVTESNVYKALRGLVDKLESEDVFRTKDKTGTLPQEKPVDSSPPPSVQRPKTFGKQSRG